MEESTPAARTAAIAGGNDAGAVEKHHSIRIIVNVEKLFLQRLLRIAPDVGHGIHAVFMEAVGSVHT